MIIHRVVPPAVLGMCLSASLAPAAEPPTQAALALADQLRDLKRTYLQSEQGREMFPAGSIIRIEPDGESVRVIVPEQRLGETGDEFYPRGDTVATVTPLATPGAYRVSVVLPARADFAKPLDDGGKISLTLGAHRLQGVWRTDLQFITDLDISIGDVVVTKSGGGKSRTLGRLDGGAVRFAAAEDAAHIWQGSGSVELSGIKIDAEAPGGDVTADIRRIAFEGDGRGIRPADWVKFVEGPNAFDISRVVGDFGELAGARVRLAVDGARAFGPKGIRFVSDRLRLGIDGAGLDPLVWQALAAQAGAPRRIASGDAETGIGSWRFDLDADKLHIRDDRKDLIVADRLTFDMKIDAAGEIGDATVDFGISGFTTQNQPTPPSLLPTTIEIAGVVSPVPVRELVAVTTRGPGPEANHDNSNGRHRPDASRRDPPKRAEARGPPKRAARPPRRSGARRAGRDNRLAAAVDALRRHGTSLRVARLNVARAGAALSGSGRVQTAAADAKFPVEAVLDLKSHGLESLVRRASRLIERGDGVKSVLNGAFTFYLMLLGLGESTPPEDAAHGPTQRYKIDVGGNGEIRFNGRLIDPREFARNMKMFQMQAARPR